MNDLLQWEIDWINAHPEHYEGPMHMKAVIGNVTKMYHIREVRKFIKHFTKKDNPDIQSTSTIQAI